jgi:4-hydroxybenzoate polyprenyltransferase and related prenyltransferases
MGYLISLFTFKIVLSLIVLFAIALLVSYEWKAKKAGLIGNIIISFLVALIFIYGSLSVKFSFLVLIFAFMAFLANLSREIIKDVEDVEGDIDRRTLPMKIGKKLSTVFASVFLLIAITISPIPYLYFHWNIYYLIAVLLADILFLVSIIFSFNNPKRGQEFIKFGMLVGLVAFLIGGAV